ncbi:PR domain zinc finger protein 10-like [Styela clava]
MVEKDQLFDPEMSGQKVIRIYNKTSKSKARSSLPDILAIKKVGEHCSVFAKCSLSLLSQFGPLEAPLVTRNEMDGSGFIIKLDINKCKRLENVDASYIYYDMSDENMCNWMMFVQPAKSYTEQNLCAHQEEDFIYFTTTRQVLPDEELKVWYSPTYAKFLSVPLLTSTSGCINSSKAASTSSSTMRKTKTSVRMQVYLNSERDVRSVPPKKRAWRKARDRRRDVVNFSSFPNRSLSKRIVRKTVVKIPEIHSCLICGKVFKNREKLNVHQVVHSSARNFLCHYCGSTFKRKDKLHDHMITFHSTSERRKPVDQINLDKYVFKCLKCSIGFQRRGMFINHMIKKHPDINTNSIKELSYPILKSVLEFKCPYCDKVYKSSTKRKLHIQRQHPGSELPVSIKQTKSCQNLGNMQNTTITLKERISAEPNCCPHCNRQYSSKNKLKKHISDKHDKDEVSQAMQNTSDCNVVPPIAQIVENSVLINYESHGNSTAMPSHGSVERPQSQLYEIGSVPFSSVPVPQNYGQSNNFSNSLPNELSPTYCNQVQDFYSHSSVTASQIDSNMPHHANISAWESSPVKNTTGSYSRYPLGRKQILKAYESRQNYSTLQPEQSSSKMPQQQQSWKSYKSHLLNNDSVWRQTDDNDRCKRNNLSDTHTDNSGMHSGFTDLHLTPSNLYSATASILDSNGNGEPLLVNERATPEESIPEQCLSFICQNARSSVNLGL